MEAKELMINDIISVGGTVQRVIQIGKAGCTVLPAEYPYFERRLLNIDYDKEVCVLGIGTNTLGYYNEVDIYPITLTPDFLEKNGFFVYMSTFSKVKTKFYSSYELLKKGIVFSVENDQDINSFIRIDNYVVFKLNYIHELQHLLRMCKMIDKSDNFIL